MEKCDACGDERSVEVVYEGKDLTFRLCFLCQDEFKKFDKEYYPVYLGDWIYNKQNQYQINKPVCPKCKSNDAKPKHVTHRTDKNKISVTCQKCEHQYHHLLKSKK